MNFQDIVLGSEVFAIIDSGSRIEIIQGIVAEKIESINENLIRIDAGSPLSRRVTVAPEMVELADSGSLEIKSTADALITAKKAILDSSIEEEKDKVDAVAFVK